MTAYAPHYTFRYWFRYSSLGDTHDCMWRFESDSGAPTIPFIVAKLTSFLNAITTYRFTDWTLVSHRYSVADDLVSFPAGPLPAINAGTAAIPGTPGGINRFRPQQTRWQGRTIGGNPAAFSLFGCPISLTLNDGNFRITAAEDATVANSIVVLGGGGAVQVGNDDRPIVWYDYVNQKDNDFWLKRVRG